MKITDKEWWDKDTNPIIIKYENFLAKSTENLPGWLSTSIRWIFGTQIGSGAFMAVLSLIMTLPYQLCYDYGYWVASDVFWWLMVIFFAWPAFLTLFYIFYGLIYKYIIRNLIMGEGR